MKKGTLILIILTIIIILLIAVLLWPVNKTKTNNQSATKNTQQIGAVNQQIVEGIQVTSPKSNDEISSPLTITGLVNEGGWAGFEGQVGTVQLLDVKGKEIAKGVLKATSDWTKPPIQFESTLTFQTKSKGAATLLFSNENPSGSPANDRKFGLPVVVK